MSTTELTLFAEDASTEPKINARRDKWWGRFAQRCAGPECPHRGKLWPSWLRKLAGTEFDGRWYCEVGCMKSAVTARIHNLLASFVQEKPRIYRLPIGLVFVHRGLITPVQLREALRIQRDAGQGRLGGILREMQLVTDQQLAAALASQWGCPVFPLDRQPAHLSHNDLLPLRLLESSRSVPVHFSSDGRVLHLAFCERLDHTTLYAVEQMLGCRTFPCAAPESAVSAVLDHFRRTASNEETCFDSIRDPREMAWTICSYAEYLKSTRTAIARSGSYVWVRFFQHSISRDLLFRILPEVALSPSAGSSGATKVFSIAADRRKGGVSHAAEQV